MKKLKQLLFRALRRSIIRRLSAHGFDSVGVNTVLVALGLSPTRHRGIPTFDAPPMPPSFPSDRIVNGGL